MTSATKVSVIITCFNLGEFLEEALSSVHAQTCKADEIVIVDDGSTESATLLVLDRVHAGGIRVIRRSNGGLPAARNTGIAATSADLVCCLDADDRLLPTFLERSVAVLDANPELAFASHWLRTFGAESSDWRPERCDFPLLLDMNTVNGAAVVRRTALEAIGGYDGNFTDGCEDWDLWISLVEAGLPGTIIPEVLFEYRRRPGSMSRRMLERLGHAEMYSRLVEKHRDTFREHLPALLHRRERDLMTMRREAAELEVDVEWWLIPELRGLQFDVQILEDRAEALDGPRREAARLAALEQSRDAALVQLDDARREVAKIPVLEQTRDAALAQLAADHVELIALTDNVRRLDARANRAEEDARALRASLSWKLTAPLRHLHDLLTGRGRDA